MHGSGPDDTRLIKFTWVHKHEDCFSTSQSKWKNRLRLTRVSNQLSVRKTTVMLATLTPNESTVLS